MMQQLAMAEEEQQEDKAICWSGCAAPEPATQQRARMVGAVEKQQVGACGDRQHDNDDDVSWPSEARNTGASSPTVKAAYDCCLRDPQQLKEDVHEAGSVYVDHRRRRRRRRCRRRLPSSSSSQSSVYCPE